MNWKLVLIGGVAFYATMFLLSMITGPVLHEGILKATYMAHAEFWRPELAQDPPDMAALMPRWITTGLIASFLLAGVYGVVRPAFAGSGWQRGLKYGLALFVIGVASMLGWSGVFDLPDTLWVWWAGEALLMYAAGGIVLGWVAGKLAPLPTAA